MFQLKNNKLEINQTNLKHNFNPKAEPLDCKHVKALAIFTWGDC